MTESTNNSTFVPLGSERIFIGTYDSTVAYNTAKLSLLSDQACEIIVYTSQNKTHTSATQLTTVANTQYIEYIQLASPYMYCTVRNKGSSAQTVLNFTTLYSVSQTQEPSSGNNSNVNIFDSSGGIINSEDFSLNVRITNTPLAVTLPIDKLQTEIFDSSGNSISSENNALQASLYANNGTTTLITDSDSNLKVVFSNESIQSNLYSGDGSTPISGLPSGGGINSLAVQVLNDITNPIPTTVSNAVDINNFPAGFESTVVNSSSNPVIAQMYADFSGTLESLSGINFSGRKCLEVYQPVVNSNHNLFYDGIIATTGKAGVISAECAFGMLKQVSIFGNVSALQDGTTPLNIYIAYSDDGYEFFTSSLGAINITTAGDFSRDFTTGAQYIGIYFDTLATVKIYYNIIA